MPKDVTNNAGNQSLVAHQFPLTIFPDNSAQSMYLVHDMTLPGLAELIRITHAPSKEQLPLLKMAVFGEERSAKNCLRTNANMQDISGIEAEHDAGDISYKAAVKILRDAHIRCVIYTTPSHVPVHRERWRILCPLSQSYDKAKRAGFVARLNGLFGGRLARESFAMSQAFYFGSVEGQKECSITLPME